MMQKIQKKGKEGNVRKGSKDKKGAGIYLRMAIHLTVNTRAPPSCREGARGRAYMRRRNQ
jgi:hypothetical protein